MSSPQLVIAATFAAQYYQTLVSTPQSLAKLYNANAVLRHTEAPEVTGPTEIAKTLARCYPEDHHGRIVINHIEPKTFELSQIRFLVKGRYLPAADSQNSRDFTHLVELKEHTPGSKTYGIISDIISWTPVPKTQASTTDAKPSAAVAPPPVMKSWSEDTPPLFSQAPPKAAISPLQQPMAPPVMSPPPLVVSEDPATESPPLAPAVATEEPTPVVAEEPKPATPAATPAPEPKQPEVDTKNMTLSERLRLKQNLAAKEEKKTAEPETKKVVVAPAPKEDPKKAAAAAKTAPAQKTEKPQSAEPEEKKSADDKKPAAKKEGDKAPKAEGDKKGPRVLSSNVVYYHLILKGLPRGTSVEELYALLEPYIPIIKPIKLEARSDKTDPSTIRTFAFVLLDLAKLPATGVDGVMSQLKGKKLQLHGTNVIVDRVREKYLEKK